MKFRKIISGTAAGALLMMSAAVALPVSPVMAADGSPVIKVDFDTNANYTLNGAAKLVQGRDGNALSLDGTSGTYAGINSIADALTEVTGDFTIGVWVNPTTTTTWSRIYDFGNGSSGTYVFLTPSNGSVPRFAVTTNGTGAEQIVNSEESLSTGMWHNVTITRKGTTTTFYVDGIPTGTTEALSYKFSEIGKMQNYYLGKSQFDNDPYFNGMIDDFVVYDYAMEETEVQNLAAEAYERIKNETVLQNNCYVINTNFYDSDGTEIFAYNGGVYISGKSIGADAAEFTLNNALGEDVDLGAYTAVYDDKGALKSLASKPVKAADVTTDAQKITVPVVNPDKLTDVKLFVWNGMEPVSEADGGVKVISSIENNTASAGAVSAALYAVAADGSETKLADSEAKTINSLESAEFTLTAADVPKGTAKVIVRAQAANQAYDAATLYCGITGPVAAPPDSSSTTDGAHDPSIVQFPGDPTYYVYSSHHLIFTSEDLVNWKKYDFTNINASLMSPKTNAFIKNNYSNTTMNGTYWAPDVIYRESDDHPYWAYLSLSCGLGGRNSAIALVKSNSPLFWADKSADIIDEGVVFATKDNSSYITNAIDANIYTDSNSGRTYFIYGSFWGGIQAIPMTKDGKVEGVDYSSDAKLLSSCAAAAKQGITSIFTQKRGVAGPEGAWMHENNGYRYCYTSYGWLGSNYNTRIARSPLSQSFADNISTQLVDANGVVVGQEYGRSSGRVKTNEITGYKLIGSYRLGDGAKTLSEHSSSNSWYYERSSDDAHVYYGSGHNSVITAPNGESFYCAHVRKDNVEGAATLQIRKLMYTADGWPVVSAVGYAGEKEQALPKDMLVGTYDLASVGHTKLDGTDEINENWSNHSGNRNYDLPIASSKVTLNADGTMAGGLGTWTFDGDHTITLTFAKDGVTANDEFYKSGDVMTMYALYGYDKDERNAVIALTGTDQNHITQFASKPVVNSYKTPAKTIEGLEPVSLAKSTGGNPELGFDTNGNVVYAGDPAATVIGDTVYLIAGHDTASDESYVMPEWVLYTSKNMTDWEFKGTIMKATDISWRSNDTSAWASQMTEYNGKYYFYYCTWDKTSSGKQSIGVAVADKPEGPYKDPLGAPLVSGNFTTPGTASHDDIDPTVLIDIDADGVEHRYLAWGNTRYYVAELNEDMISLKDIDGDGAVTMHVDVKERTIKSMPGSFTEAPWLYKRDGKYYLFYAMNWREEMAYAMCDEPFGRYDYKQTIMPPNATANTNHPSVIDFNGKTYFIYHNGALPHGSGFRRSVCIQELEFDENGYVIPLTETSIGLDGTASVIKSRSGEYVAHDEFRNPLADANYPLSYPLTVKTAEDGYNTAWELEEAKYVPAGENAEHYVSIQSVNKPGLYIKSTSTGVVLTQDADGKQGEAMTFKTVTGIDDKNGVSFESVSRPGCYLTVTATGVTLSSTGANATFYVEDAAQKDVNVVSPADPEPDPVAGEDVLVDFNSAVAGTIMSLGTAAVPDYTEFAGLTLKIGARSGGGNANTAWLIENGSGIDGSKALVMSISRFANAGRGPRMAITTPPIPNGKTVTAEFKAKLNTGAELYYDSEANSLTGMLSTTDWSTVKVAITNDNDTYIRKIFVNDTEVGSDYTPTFPEFFGNQADNGGAAFKVYIDNVEIKTVDKLDDPEPAPPVEKEVSEHMVFGMDFDDRDGSTLAGQAKINGTLSYGIGSNGTYAASLSGSGGWLEIKNKDGKGVFDGLDRATITFKARANSGTSWWLYAAPDSNAQTWQAENYLGCLDNGSNISIERYKGGRYTPAASDYTTGAWKDVVIAVNEDTTNLYVDGKLVNSQKYNMTLSDILGSNSVSYIGKANWGSGEYASGMIDEFMIYDYSIIPQIGDLSNLTADITLSSPTKEKDGYTITWTTSDAGVITDSGKVTRPAEGKAYATLTATVEFENGGKVTQDFDVAVAGIDSYDYTLAVSEEKGVDIQDGMYGLFFEDINYAADGGLYAEMIENRSFEALKNTGKANTTYDGMYGWSAYPSGGTSGLALKTDNALNKNNTHYLSIQAGVSVKNQAYDGVYMEAGKTYNVSAYVRGDNKPVSVKVYSDGTSVAEAALAEQPDSEWKKYEAAIVPSKTVRNADFVISSEGAADIDMVSCMPADAVEGVFRRDLAEKLKALNPGFLRFPGGCVIEGYDLNNRYNWKDSVGPAEERKQNWNRWSTHLTDANVKDGGYKHYNQTYGLGFYEYFALCEYLGAKAVPVVNCGLGCQYQSSEVASDITQYIQDALDLIEFANGDVSTTWGKVRADMGHPEPFNMEYIGVGNEQWQTSSNNFQSKYEQFEAAIHAAYPDMKIVGTAGPSVNSDTYNTAWNWIRIKAKTNPNFAAVVDEHYYMTPDWFYANDSFYDNYDRNVKVFAGEYASRGSTDNKANYPQANTLLSAISEAAFMTGLERNADVVYMASYAPLFARVNYTQWSPDMIWFDDMTSYVSPTYYTQYMYSNYTGDYTLKSEVSNENPASKLYQSVSYDTESKEMIIKLVNNSTGERTVRLELGAKTAGTAKAAVLAGNDLYAYNSIEAPDTVKMTEEDIDISSGRYTMPAQSFTVLRIPVQG